MYIVMVLEERQTEQYPHDLYKVHTLLSKRVAYGIYQEAKKEGKEVIALKDAEQIKEWEQ